MAKTDDIDDIRALVVKYKHQYEQAKTKTAELSKDSMAIENTVVATEEAQKILQFAAQAVQQEAHDKIARTVTACLQAIFDDPYEFKIRFEQKRGKTEAVLIFSRGGVELEDPLHESGGGAVDVAAFAMRLVSLVLQRPEKRRLLVLDEPFKNIRGQRYRRRMRGLIDKLSSDFNVQFLLNIDHQMFPEFVGGHVIDMEAE